MRFFKDGPNVPDELLVARDEGRVIVFCGAGVSIARVRLPNFFQLAERVMDHLGSVIDSPSRKLVQMAANAQQIDGVSGIFSADRVFSLLEREFPTALIESAVAKALVPPTDDPDLSAHRFVLDLATGPDGKVRLVTTNFDLMFEACDPNLPHHAPPRLPSPSRSRELVGVTHLHGHVRQDHCSADHDGLVLSSGQFGLAYLSESWATDFFRGILERYHVLFLGYAADDPPVTYLLEALGRTQRDTGKIYAFHAGAEDNAQAIWRQRGVRAIAYQDTADHQFLWQTIEGWAERTRNPTQWSDKVIERSLAGPEELERHERGQVAHLISTPDGARRFSLAQTPPPATWLCAFDPKIRFAPNGQIAKFGQTGPVFDPFAAYSLDSDDEPEKRNDDTVAPVDRGKVPAGAWDAFEDSQFDRNHATSLSSATLRGYRAVYPGIMSARLHAIKHWIARVASQPAAVWWASGQNGLHPELVRQVMQAINRQKNISTEIRAAWRCIEMHSDSYAADPHDRFDLQTSIGAFGWDIESVIRVAEHMRPRLKVGRPLWGGPKPPLAGEGLTRRDLVDVDIEYPDPLPGLTVPTDMLVPLIRASRKNLELAAVLENGIGGYELKSLPPFEADPSLVGASRPFKRGLPGAVFCYLSLLQRLAAASPPACLEEAQAWPREDRTIFARLRIWIAGQEEVTPEPAAAEILIRLPSRVFWDAYHQRDLLLVLKRRWEDFSETTKKRIETRLRRGPPRWRNEETEKFKVRRLEASLVRIDWLRLQGCQLSPSIQAHREKVRNLLPRWADEWAANAAASHEATGGWVGHDTTHDPLIGIPLADVVPTAASIKGLRISRLTEQAPFEGLVAKRPARALASLVARARLGDFPDWAWSAFLQSDARKNDRPKFLALVGKRLAGLPDQTLASISYPVATWLDLAGEHVFARARSIFDCLWMRLMSALSMDERARTSNVLRTKGNPDWATEALNSPAGKLAQLVPRLNPSEDDQATSRWLILLEQLLQLPGDARRHALTIFAYHLQFFFAKDEKWTERELLSATKASPHDRDAFWAGFLWRAHGPSDLLFAKLKNDLLGLVREDIGARRSHMGALAGLLLGRWVSGHLRPAAPRITDDEMRTALLDGGDDMRQEVLWLLGNWARERSEDVDWPQVVSKFVNDVWPRQRKASTQATSSALAAFAFDSGDLFPTIVTAILPLLSPLDTRHFGLPVARNTEGDDYAPAKYPEQTLALLDAVLPANAQEWPHGIAETFDAITNANPELSKDERMIELRRSLASR